MCRLIEGLGPSLVVEIMFKRCNLTPRLLSGVGSFVMGLLGLTLAYKYCVVSMEIKGIVESWDLLNHNSKRRVVTTFLLIFFLYNGAFVAYNIV
jgi:hypothetical protein